MNSPYERPGPRDPDPGQRTDAQARQHPPTHAGAQLREQAGQLGEHAVAEAKARADRQAHMAAEELDALADGADAAAERLDQTEHEQLSHYVSGIARSLGDLADGLRRKSADELLGEVSAIARRNPALFVTGAVALGFGLTRFARASARRADTGASRAMAPQQTMPDRRTDTGLSDGAHAAAGALPPLSADGVRRAYAAPAATAGLPDSAASDAGATRVGAPNGIGSSGPSPDDAWPRGPGGSQP